jgi:L-arabinose transport system substrate-binding protein
MFKKLFALSIVLTLTLIHFGCGKSDESGTTTHSGTVKIGFIVKQPEVPWFQLEWQFAEQAGKQNGFEVIKIGAADGEKVLSAIDNLAASGAQGFVICTPDTKLGSAIMNKAKMRGLKVLAVDDQFIGADGKPMTDVPYLGISARKIGNSVGEWLLTEMKKRNWPVEETGVCAVTFEELDTARTRTDGAIESLVAGGFSKDRIFKAPQKTSDQPGSLDAVNILLTQQPGIKRWLVCGMNDDAVLGAVRALEGRGFTADNVIGIGIGGTECVSEFEKPNKTGFFASSLLQAKLHGYQTSEMMYKWIKDGTEPARETLTIGALINRDNFQQLLKEQGIR